MSLWTGTPAFQVRRDHLLLHTLAACCAGEVFAVTEFVTDSKGLELADRFGWRYTTYLNALDDFADPAIRHVWALGKLVAMTLQEGPFCHLDNDVILQLPLPERITKAALFAQSKDKPGYYSGGGMKEAVAKAQLPANAVAYNAGIIGGQDHQALRAYASEALYRATLFRGQTDNGTAASMVVEQYFLGVYARRHRIRVEELLPLGWTDHDCREVGYTHLIGKTKRSVHWAGLVERKLAAKFPEAYQRFLKGWEKLHG